MMSLIRLGARAVAGSIIVVFALSLVACSGASNKPITDYKGEPKKVDAPPSSSGGAPFSVWMKDGAQFTITLYGSSSCPPTGAALDVTGTNKITVAVADLPKNKACTMDYVPHTTVFATPSAIDPHADVKVTVQDVRFTLQAIPK